MLDLNSLRKETQRARKGLTDRGGRSLPALEELLKLDAEHRALLTEVESLRAARNAASQTIGKAKAARDETLATRLMGEVAQLKERMVKLEGELSPLAEKTRAVALSLPNVPHESVPVGADESQNVEVRKGAPPRRPDRQPLDHQTIGERLGLLDFDAASKLAGSRFALWKGAGARLVRAIIQFQLDLHVKAGYVEVLPPYLVKPEILEGTGQLPKFEADLYKTVNTEGEKASEFYLIPTAEVPLTNLVRETILKPGTKFPIKYTAYTPCFRQEAGSYGKDVRGLIRNHQFDKVELVWITKPEDSLAALEQLTADAEAVLKVLDIPHRVVALCTGDLGFAARKTYDIEAWMPAEGRYREISSCSECGDFQARRMAARFKRSEKDQAEFVHTLNGSGVAVGRLFAAILENGQQKDGSVALPKALTPYVGAERIGPA